MVKRLFLYLQNYSKENLIHLKNHLNVTFDLNLILSKRPDGHNYILKTTQVTDTFRFLDKIMVESLECPSMYYKTNWAERFEMEAQKWNTKFPLYKVIASNSDRSQPYSDQEISKLFELKEQKKANKEIAEILGRSYWSVVYKWSELKKDIKGDS